MKKNKQNTFSYKKNKKKKNNKKHIKSLQNQQGKILTTNSEILEECKNYFQNLYKKHVKKLKTYF